MLYYDCLYICFFALLVLYKELRSIYVAVSCQSYEIFFYMQKPPSWQFMTNKKGVCPVD